MSKELAEAFLERMKKDDAFKTAVIKKEDPETKIAYINRKGYQFTSDELEAATYSMIE
jgi:predicted ribosomally synthesized peptide with nif11-like leader